MKNMAGCISWFFYLNDCSRLQVYRFFVRCALLGCKRGRVTSRIMTVTRRPAISSTPSRRKCGGERSDGKAAAVTVAEPTGRQSALPLVAARRTGDPRPVCSRAYYDRRNTWKSLMTPTTAAIGRVRRRSDPLQTRLEIHLLSVYY